MKIEYDNMSFKARKRGCPSPMLMAQSDEDTDAQIGAALNAMREMIKAGKQG